MGTSVTPEQQQEQNQSQNNSEGQENSTQATEAQAQASPTNSEAGSKAERLLSLYEENMRAAHQRASQLQQELERRDRAQEEAARNQPPQVPDMTASEFWNKPLPAIAQIIRDETRKAVQPLYDFKQQFENQSKYDGVKNRFKSDPRYKDIFPKIENIVDQMMQGQDPNDALMNATILSAIGALHTGQLPGVELEAPRTTQPNVQPQNDRGLPPTQATSERVITPPHLRPSATAQNTGVDTKPKLRDLTELEERLRRENGMSKEDFISWMDLPAHEVALSKIGKPPAETNPQSQVVRQTSASPNTGQGR